MGNGIWESFTGILTSISAHNNGEIWGTNSGTNIFRNNCPDNAQINTPIKSENSISATLNMYPNPANDKVNLNISPYNGKRIKVALVNLLGQKVMDKSFGNSGRSTLSIDVSSLQRGIYILTIEVEGQQSISKRLMVN